MQHVFTFYIIHLLQYALHRQRAFTARGLSRSSMVHHGTKLEGLSKGRGGGHGPGFETTARHGGGSLLLLGGFL